MPIVNVNSSHCAWDLEVKDGDTHLGDTWGTVGCVDVRRCASFGAGRDSKSRLKAASVRCNQLSTDQKVLGFESQQAHRWTPRYPASQTA